ncbi:hypothetical protein C8J56DRAFT_972134 [Mycena floridula]|nr:hypothetical protein C8J56DRAFT_972134 [Mycena floridula]
MATISSAVSLLISSHSSHIIYSRSQISGPSIFSSVPTVGSTWPKYDESDYRADTIPAPKDPSTLEDKETWVFGFEVTDEMAAYYDKAKDREPTSYDRKCAVLYEIIDDLRIPRLVPYVQPQKTPDGPCLIHFAITNKWATNYTIPLLEKLNEMCKRLGKEEGPKWIRRR